MKIDFVFANNVDPDEISHQSEILASCHISPGSSLFVNTLNPAVLFHYLQGFVQMKKFGSWSAS